VGYTIELQFTVNTSDYIFRNLEAVSSSDTSKKRNNLVTFTQTEGNEKTGVYKITLKLLEAANDILIRPVCTPLPKITEITPKFESAGCDQDTPIKITFNKAVNPASFFENVESEEERSFANFKKITIYSDDGDISEHYSKPYFSSDYKSLYIPVDTSKLILAPDGSKNSINIEVNYDFTEATDFDGLSLSSAAGNFQYKVNKNYGNQKKVTVLVNASDETGKFLSAGEKECTVGYTIDVQFTVKKSDYKFKEFEAVSNVDGSSRASSVSFENLEKDDDSGVYKAKVRVTEEKNDILIRPVCILIPKITEITPKFESAGCAQDSSIAISFNKPLDSESFADFKGILLYSDEDELTKYFGPLSLSKDKKTAYLQALASSDSTKLLLPPDGTKNTMTIKVQYDFSGTKDADGLEITQSGIHEYKINKTYGNQKTVTVLVEADEAQGKFLSAGEKECSVGYTIDVQFTLKKSDYKFKEFEAVSNVDGLSRASSVSFENLEKDDDSGVYKAKVRVKEEKNDILIRPVCTPLPKITEITPKFESAGCDQDTAIKIEFNKSVNPESFFEDGITEEERSVQNLKGISIYSDDGDLAEYFGKPYFSDGNKAMYIPTLALSDNTMLMLPPDGAKSSMTVKVQYNFTGSVDADEIAVTQSGTHEYKINKNYGNQKKVTVLVEADEAQGKFLSAGEKECSVGYTIDVQFTVKKSDYKFKEFEAVSNTDGASRSGSVSFENIEKDDEAGVYKAKVRVNEEKSDIVIRPKCQLIPKVSGTTPKFESAGVEQDSKIEITFNKAVNPETFTGTHAGISIYNDEGEDLAEYFAQASFSDDSKSLIVTPLGATDIEKLFLPPDKAKSSMSIKVQYNFAGAKDSEGIEITQSGSFEYKINKNYANQKVVKELVESNDESLGKFLSDGEKECSVGFTIELQFTVVTKDYSFEGLEAVSAKNNSVSREDCVLFMLNNPDEAESTGVYKYTVKLLKDESDILIRPKFEKLANANIKIDGTHGQFSPAKDTYNVIKGRNAAISFEPDSDYEFIRWQIYDEKTGEEIPNGIYIKLNNSADSDTTYMLTSIPEDKSVKLAIRPIVAERPQILSYTPLYVAAGTNKDSTVQVMFDYDMDKSSIYYTKEEILNLYESGIAYTDFLPEVTEDELSENGSLANHYGYKKNSDIFYKNISIKDYRNGRNLNNRFNAPVFENSKTLSITQNKKNEIDNYSQIIVTLEKDFCYDLNGKKIVMAGSKKWIYQVNKETDSLGPSIANDGDIKVSILGKELDILESKPALTDMKFINPPMGKEKHLSLNVTSTDTGSGPSTFFKIILRQIQNEKYEDVASALVDEETVYYDYVTSQNGSYEGKIDLANLKDGVYELSFVFSDRSGNSGSFPEIPKNTDGTENTSEQKKYYFAVDTAIPEIEPAISSSNSTTYNLSWTDVTDLKNAEILYKEDDTEMPAVLVAKGIQSGNITDIAAGKIYDVKVKFTDFAGNYTEKTIPKFLTGYYTEGTLDFNKENASHAAKVFFAGDNLSDYGVNSIKIAWSDGTVEDVIPSGYIIPNGPNNNSVFNSDWKLFYKKEGEIDKYAAAPGSYYIAKKDSLTQVPEFYQESEGWCCKFGDYPQRVSGNTNASSFTTEKVYNGWYIGENGYFYEKCHTNISGKATTTAGGTLPNNADCYFRVQPIEWRYASNNYNGKRILIARKNLDGVQYYTSTSDRSVNGSTIKPNNYMYSTLRAFLNGKYESGDTQTKSYQDKGFLQRAFTPYAQNLIYEGAVDNSAVTTNPKNEPGKWGNGANANICGTTYDKVFALSVQEATNTDFGFHYKHDWKMFGLRLKHTTDYAKAKHVFESRDSNNTGTSDTFASIYWLRSPSRGSGETGLTRIVDTEAIIKDRDVTTDNSGVVPAILLK